jgi:hypothetical protein
LSRALVVLQKQFFGATELPPTSSVKLFGSQSEDFTNELNLAKHIPFPAGISGSVRVRSAAPSAKWWCGQRGEPVP